jgi:hypothetical protein
MLLVLRIRGFLMAFAVGSVREPDGRQRAGERELRELIREQSESVN